MHDPEIRDLQVATARAYAIAERLASELENTVAELLNHVQSHPHGDSVDDDGRVQALLERIKKNT